MISAIYELNVFSKIFKVASGPSSHLAPCWGQRRALLRLRPPQRDQRGAADASLAGHLGVSENG